MKPYRRSESPNAPYYIQISVDGKRRQVSTGKTDYQEAVTEGMRLTADARNGATVQAKAKAAGPTLAQIMAIYVTDGVNSKEQTRTANVRNMKRLLFHVGLTSESSPSALTRQIVMKFQSTWLRLHPGKETSANSCLRQARSIFARDSMPLYADLGPFDVGGFMSQSLLQETRKYYSPPPKETLDKLFAALPALKKTDPSCYAAFTIACYTGMRAGEIVAARWDWVKYSQSTGAVYIEIPGQFSKSNQDRLLPIAKEVLAELKSVRNRSEFLVPASTPHARLFAVQRRHSRWLADNGMKRNGKTNHELRKFFGANIASTQGLYAAQKLLGHSSPKLTSDVYAALIQLPAPLPLRSAAVSDSALAPALDTTLAAC